MKKVDFYLQHLVRHQAKDIVLASGKPVLFGFPQGSRASNNSLDHPQLEQLVRESAPPEAMEALKRQGRMSYRHAGQGVEVAIQVEARQPNHWKVVIAPATAKAPAADAPRQERPAAAPRNPAPQRSPGQQNGRPAAGAPAATAQRPPASGIPFSPEPSKGPEAAAKTPPAADKSADAEATSEVGPARVSREQAPQPVPGEPAVNRYLRWMVNIGASDLHLSATVPPMVRHDGEMKAFDGEDPLEPDALEAMLLEIAPEKNKNEFSERSDTDFAHAIEGVARFRANYFADRKGAGAVFRQIPFKILKVDKLGLPKGVLDLCWLSKGLVVVTGPTGSGKSTTLASLIDYINDHRTDHIITIEDPIEFVHNNKKCLINQREVGLHTKSFKAALRAALREDPDIVLVGEMRDLETIAIAIETAETGHLVFGTLHTTSAKSTVDRIIDQFPADQQEQIRVMLSESLRGVIAQVLCKKIGGGRAAGYEVMISNSAVANLIREGKTFQLTSVMQTGKNLGMQTMNDHLLEHVKEGRVEAEEAYIKSNDKHTFKEALKRNNITLKV